jgi:hypothetical protein
MIGPYGIRASKGPAHCFFELIFVRIPVAGQNLFGLPHGNLDDIGFDVMGRQQNNSADLAQGDPRTRVSVQRKDILDNYQVGLFSDHQIMNAGVDFVQACGDGRLLMRSDHAICKAGDLPSISGDNADAGGCQTGINADDFDYQCCNMGIPAAGLKFFQFPVGNGRLG